MVNKIKHPEEDIEIAFIIIIIIIIIIIVVVSNFIIVMTCEV